MHIFRKRSSTSNVLRAKLRSSATGNGLTGLTSASSGLIISTVCDNEASATTYTVAGSTIESITTLGTFATPTSTKCRFKEVDATNHPGLYEFQFADARFAVASSKVLRISATGATNLADKEIIVQLTSFDPDDAVRGGMTAMPNANAEAAGGLYTRGTGAGQINQEANGRVDINLKAIAGATTIDGVGIASFYRALIAMLVGKCAVTDNGATRTLSFKQQDGSTESFTVTVAEADGARASTGSIT